jgi:DNA modification methylase
MPDANVTQGAAWTLVNGDSCEQLPTLAADSVDLSVYSPPFSSLFTYSATERDIGNCSTHEEFLAHLGFVIRELFRVTKPGRLSCCHIAQLPSSKAMHGVIGLIDLRGAMIQAFTADGWIYHGEVCIDKDPQAQAIRTHAKGLLFVQLKKDRSWMRPALADYILLFRKPGDNQVPIVSESNFIGDDGISNEEWIEFARPIWYGIRESDTLNAAVARENDDERHICPLQLGTIERCIRLWSNPGELVLSPFAGIGSEGYEAVRLGRRYWGCELKPSYARVAVKNLQMAETLKTQGSLLDAASQEVEA